MKIALFYASWEKFGEPWSTPLGFKWELESRGHEIQFYNLYHADGQILPRHTIRSYSSASWNDFHAHYNKGYKPDAVLVMDYGPFDCFQMDKQYFHDVTFVLEAGDTPQSFGNHAIKARKFDIIMTPDKQAAERFTAMGVQGVWATHYGDERIFYPRPQTPILWDCVSTCGGRRVTAAISKALGEQFNNERYFFGNAHAERLCAGKMVFQCSQFGEITRRVFEGMACGKMVITDRLPEVTQMHTLFEDGRDIVYYDTAEDAIDKIRYYASHDDEREAIALRGYAKVMAEHTVAKRVDLFEEHILKVRA